MTSQNVYLRAVGIKTSGSDIDSSPDGSNGVDIADNVVLNKEGLWEPRRGQATHSPAFTTTPLSYLSSYRDYLLTQGGDSAWLWSLEGQSGTSAFSGSVPSLLEGTFTAPSSGRFSAVESNSNLYMNTAEKVLRLDSPTGTVMDAGVPGALNVYIPNDDTNGPFEGVTKAAGTAIPGDSQLAYRVLFGLRDANNTLHYGSPSGRGIVVSPSITVQAGAVTRSGTVATVTYANHPFKVGEEVTLGPSDTSPFTAGNYTIQTVTAGVSFTITVANTGAAANTIPLTIKRTPRNVQIETVIPDGVTSGAFFYQIYRSPSSGSAGVSPSDELGLVYEAPVPQAVALAFLERTTTTVTATTAAPHSFSAGSTIRLPTGLAGASAALAAIGANVGASSINAGASWTSRTQAQDIRKVAWNGSVFAGVGNNAATSSPDATTWTSRTPAVASRNWTGLTYGSAFVAVAPGILTSNNTTNIASSSTTTASSSNTRTLTNVTPGTTVVTDLVLYNQSDSTQRNVTYTCSYRVNGGAWTQMSTTTWTVDISETRNVSVNSGALPLTGTIDIKQDLAVASIASWPQIEVGDGVFVDPTIRVTIDTTTYTGVASRAMTSSNGTTWADGGALPFANNDVYSLVGFNGSSYVALGTAVSGATTNYRTASSSDGSTWTANATTSILADKTISGLASNGLSLMVAVGDNRSLYSTDSGVSWTQGSIPSGVYHAVIWAPHLSLFVAVGAGVSAVSSDGINWTSTSAGLPAGETFYSLSLDGNTLVATGVSTGTGGCATSTDGSTWTSRVLPAGTYYAVASSPAASIAAGFYVVTENTDSTHFKFTTSNSGAISSTATSQVVVPVTVGVIDSVPDSLLGQSLYTNQNQQGIAQSNTIPPASLDICKYRNTMFYAAPLRAPSITVSLLAAGSPKGVQSGDKLTFANGSFVTAGSTEDAANRVFKVVTDTGSASLNITKTVSSIINTINRNSSALGVTAIDVSTEGGPPGQFALIANSPTSSVSVSFSANTMAWSPAQGLTKAPQRDLNVLAFSKLDQPDAVPVLNTYRVGSSDKAILRAVALRDCMIVFKEDGVYKLTGSSPDDFQIQPFDLTLRLLAPESAVPLSNNIFAFTNQGVVQVSDTGVTIVSLDIENLLAPLVAPSMAATTKRLAFGVAYESDRTYSLWLPSSTTDSQATYAYVYSIYTQAWTRRTDSYRFGFVSPIDNRLWTVSDTSICRERKNLDRTDFADDLLSISLTATSVLDTRVALDDVTQVRAGDVLFQPIPEPVLNTYLPESWQPNASYPLNYTVGIYTYGNAHWVATTGGTSANGETGDHVLDEVTWPTPPVDGYSFADGTVVWTFVANTTNEATEDVWAVVTSVDTANSLVYIDREASFYAGSADIYLYEGISCSIVWAPDFGQNPGAKHHWREISVLFKDASFSQAYASFSSDLSTTTELVGMTASDLGISLTSTAQNRNIRVLVPREKARGSQLRIGYQQASAWYPFQIQGMSLLFHSYERVSK